MEPVPAKSELPPKNNPPENNVEPVPAKSELVSHSITAYLFLVSQKYRDVSVQVEIGE